MYVSAGNVVDDKEYYSLRPNEDNRHHIYGKVACEICGDFIADNIEKISIITKDKKEIFVENKDIRIASGYIELAYKE